MYLMWIRIIFIINKDCLNNAYCDGGNSINVNSGYWRSSFYSEKIYKCLYDGACISG